MSRFNRIVLALAAIAAAPTAALHAQSSLALHAGRGPDAGAPWLFGATFGVGAHGIGLRAGGAVNSLPALLDSDPDAPDPLWAVDADVMLGVPTGAGVQPYLFLGAGMQTPAAHDVVDDALTHWSWGGGLSVSFFGPASVFGEIRRRTLFDRRRPSALAPGSRASELRAGLVIGFGGDSDRDRHRPRRKRGRHHMETSSAQTPSGLLPPHGDVHVVEPVAGDLHASRARENVDAGAERPEFVGVNVTRARDLNPEGARGGG